MLHVESSLHQKPFHQLTYWQKFQHQRHQLKDFHASPDFSCLANLKHEIEQHCSTPKNKLIKRDLKSTNRRNVTKTIKQSSLNTSGNSLWVLSMIWQFTGFERLAQNIDNLCTLLKKFRNQLIVKFSKQKLTYEHRYLKNDAHCLHIFYTKDK